MKPSEKAKSLGCKSLDQVVEFSGYTIPTLSRMHRDKPRRFEAFCIAAVCDELGVNGKYLRELHSVIQQIKEGKV